MQSSERLEHLNRKDLDRLVAFSDGVFAIAITLLALNFKLPSRHLPEELELFYNDLWYQIPVLAGYIISFLVVGIYWIAHHRMVRHVVKLDGVMLWQNLFLLLFIGIVPFASLLLQNYGNLPVSCMIYAINLSMIGIMQVSIWRHASRNRRLIDEHVSGHTIAVIAARSYITPLVFMLSIPICTISPAYAELSWILAPLLWPLLRKVWPRYKEAKVSAGFIGW